MHRVYSSEKVSIRLKTICRPRQILTDWPRIIHGSIKFEPLVYTTYTIWTPSLNGTTTPVQEDGNDCLPPNKRNTNHGWPFGTQVEWFF